MQCSEQANATSVVSNIDKQVIYIMAIAIKDCLESATHTITNPIGRQSIPW